MNDPRPNERHPASTPGTPTGPAGHAKPAKAAKAAKAPKAAQPTEPAKPSASTKPSVPAKPAPAKPTSAKSATAKAGLAAKSPAPVKPAAPAKVSPSASSPATTSPVAPSVSSAPVQPAKPAVPMKPLGPVKPLEPGKPMLSAKMLGVSRSVPPSKSSSGASSSTWSSRPTNSPAVPTGASPASAPVPPPATAPVPTPDELADEADDGFEPDAPGAAGAPGAPMAGAPGVTPGGPGGSPNAQRRYDPKAPVPTANPRKVRGGLKLDPKTNLGALAWAGQRWMRLVEEHAPNANVTEGLNYARAAQTRSLSMHAGRIEARVQGRLPNAYPVEIRLPTFTHDHWEQATNAMTSEARFLASILAGEVPAGIEDLFAPLQLRLFPAGTPDISVSCGCHKAALQASAYAKSIGQPSLAPAPEANPSPWCKHVCCVMALVAERLSRDPFLIFHLRGMVKDDLLERLRQRRAVVGAAKASGGAGRPVPAYSPRIPGVGEQPGEPLAHSLADFWRLGPSMDELDLPMDKPAASHVLLRRLGASPFEAAKFPLVGLMATCYDVLTEAALREETPSDDPAQTDDAAESDDESGQNDPSA